MQMHDAAGVLAHLVDRGVNSEAGRIDVVIGFAQQVAVEIDLHEAGCGDLLEDQTVGIDQEVVLGAGHACGDVGVDEIVPAIERDEAIGCGEVDALRPFALGHVRWHGFEVGGFGWRHYDAPGLTGSVLAFAGESLIPLRRGSKPDGLRASHAFGRRVPGRDIHELKRAR